MTRLARTIATGMAALLLSVAAAADPPTAETETPPATQPDEAARLAELNPGYVTRAGAHYETQYLPRAVETLVGQADCPRLAAAAAREVLRTFCYDYLRVYTANAMAMPYSENVRLLEGMDRQIMAIVDDREAFARYRLWRDGPNALGFMMHPRYRVDAAPPAGWVVTHFDTPDKLKAFGDLFSKPPVEVALFTRTAGPAEARLPGDGPFLCLLVFGSYGSRQLAEQYEQSFAIVSEDGKLPRTRFELFWQVNNKYALFAAEGDEPADQAALKRAVRRQLLDDYAAPPAAGR